MPTDYSRVKMYHIYMGIRRSLMTMESRSMGPLSLTTMMIILVKKMTSSSNRTKQKMPSKYSSE